MSKAANLTPSVVSCFNSEKLPREWRDIDHEFYAFTKQVCREEGVVSVICDEDGKVFCVRADKETRKAMLRRYGYNTWHGSHGNLKGVLFRIDILQAEKKA